MQIGRRLRAAWRALQAPDYAVNLLARRDKDTEPLREAIRQTAVAAGAEPFDIDRGLLADSRLLNARAESVARFVVERLAPIAGHFPYPPGELHLMASAVAWHKPHVIIEWGTNIGCSARVFWYTTRAFGLSTRIFSIDLPPDVPWDQNPGDSRGKLVAGLEGITLLLGDGLERALEIGRSAAGKRLLFFVDGDHRYATVRREIEGLTSAFPDAPILLHDTHPWGGQDCPAAALADAMTHIGSRYELLSAAATMPGMSILIPRAITS